MEVKPLVEYSRDNVFKVFPSCAVSKAAYETPLPSSLACDSHCCLNFLLFFVVTEEQMIR